MRLRGREEKSERRGLTGAPLLVLLLVTEFPSRERERDCGREREREMSLEREREQSEREREKERGRERREGVHVRTPPIYRIKLSLYTLSIGRSLGISRRLRENRDSFTSLMLTLIIHLVYLKK